MPLKIDLGTILASCALAYLFSPWWLLLIPVAAIASPWRLKWSRRLKWSKESGWVLEKEEPNATP